LYRVATLQNSYDTGSNQRIILIVGPTASGKSELAVRLAEEFGGEIVNADSMQVYAAMEIGTARPSVELMARVPHHLYGFVQPDINFTAADFVSVARATISDIISRQKLPLVVGGTGLYLRALLSGLAESPSADDGYRAGLVRFASEHGLHALHEMLVSVDPVTAARLHPNDRLRVIRALEVYHQTGRTLYELQSDHGFANEQYESLKIGIDVDRSLLYERINRRVDEMIAAGLLAEVRMLLARGYRADFKSMRAIGYREACEYLAGRLSLGEAVELIKQNTRHYAKRQVTWFKKDSAINWLEYPESFVTIRNLVCDFINRSSL